MTVTCRALFVWSGVFVSTSTLASHATAESTGGMRIVVEAGKAERVDTPVSIPLPRRAQNSTSLRLTEMTDGERRSVPVQIEPGPAPRLWWIVPGRTPAGAQRTFVLDDKGLIDTADGVAVHRFDGSVQITCKGEKVLKYRTAHVNAPPGVDAAYGRSAHLHPVWTPRGQVVTDQFPPDHLHQSGIWLAYVRTLFEGRNPNGWDLKGGTGRVRHAALEGLESGPVYGRFVAHHEHVDLTAPGGEKVALRERWDLRVWNVGGPESGYWLLDLESTIRCATNSPFQMLQHHYGGLAVRGGRTWYDASCAFRTSEGGDRSNGNHTRVRWCEIAGANEGTWSGLTVMSHPANLHHPEPVRIHPSMPYFCFVPAHVAKWSIEPGQEHVSRYRFLVHDGRVAPELADRIWADFAEPPSARIASAR